MKRIKSALSLTLAAALVLSLLGPVSALAAPSLRDIKGHWAETYVKQGVDRGYIDGYTDGSFRPDNAVTRAEFCKIVNNALGVSRTTGVSFSDVGSSAWYYDEVRRAVASGYINGYEDNSFRANNQITRQEAAVIISRIMTPPASLSSMSGLSDSGDIASWALTPARAVFTKGYMTGDQNKRYRPAGNLTRAEAVKIIETLLDAERIVTGSTTVSPTGQTLQNTLYTGDVTLSGGTGNLTLQNCRVLGTLSAAAGDTVTLRDTGVNQLLVSNSNDRMELITTGLSSVKETTASRGCSLTETSLTGDGFTDVTLSGSGLRSTEVFLSGAFGSVTVSSAASPTLSSGTIAKLTIASGASGSDIRLAKGTQVSEAVINAACDFTGTGTIRSAAINSSNVTFETPPDNITGQGVLVPTVSPRNGAEGVSLNTKITLTFADALSNSAGKNLTAAIVKSDVIELRRGSETGTLVSFQASVNSSRKVITITPTDDLRKDSSYYIILLKGSLQNNAGLTNDRQVFTFYTGGLLSPVTNPPDGGDMVPVGSDITLRFSETLHDPTAANTTTLTPAYLQNSITLRKSSSNGTELPFTAKVSSDRKTITLTPKEKLSLNTRYYVSVPAGTLANDGKDTNRVISFSFTSADTDVLVPTMDPPSGSTDVSRAPLLILTFPTVLFTVNGSTIVDADYLEGEAFTLRRGSESGTVTPFTATIDKARKVVTIEPDSQLRADTDYYLILTKGTLTDSAASSRKSNAKMVFSFTTQDGSLTTALEPDIVPRNGVTGFQLDGGILLTFDEALYVPGGTTTPAANYLAETAFELREGSSSGDTVKFSATLGKDKDSVTLKPSTKLKTDTRYYVILKANTLANAYGDRNTAFSSYFNTGSGVSLPATITPADGTVGVGPNTNITLRFDDEPENVNGADLRAAYVESTAVKLYEGSVAAASARTFTATVSGRTITLSPDKNLTQGKLYYVVIPKETLVCAGLKNSEQKFSFTVGSGLSLTVTPANNATGVARDGTIRLAFNEKLSMLGGGTLDLSNAAHVTYIKNNITLKAGSDIPYTPTLSGNTIILTPNTTLAAKTKHTLTIKAGILMGASGGINDAWTGGFTTGEALPEPHMDLMGESLSAAPVQPTIRIFFDAAATSVADNTLKDADVYRAILIRRANASTGTVVPYSIVSIATDNKSFQIKPTAALERGVTYYVTLADNTLQSNKQAYGKTTFSFRVEPVTPVTVSSISPSGTNAAFGGATIQLTFNSLVTDKDGNPLTPAYVNSYFTLLEETTVLTPSANNDVVIATGTTGGKTYISFTLPADKLIKPGTTYQILATGNILKNDTGGFSETVNESFTTRLPTVGLSANYVQAGTGYDATITVTSDYNLGNYTMTITKAGGGATTLRNNFTPNAPASFTTPVTGLTPGDYTINLSYNYTGSAVLQKSTTLKVIAPSDNAKLSALSVTVLGEGTSSPTITASKFEYEVFVLPKADVTIKPTAADPDATINIRAVDGGGTTILNSQSVASGGSVPLKMPDVGDAVVTITVTAPSGNATETYTLTLKPNYAP